jgi:membrane-bound serine protease (ClpP class)
MAGLIGKNGVATTTLRPAGKAKIEGKLVDVVTQGDFIEKGAQIRVLRLEGNRIVVVPDSGEKS